MEQTATDESAGRSSDRRVDRRRLLRAVGSGAILASLGGCMNQGPSDATTTTAAEETTTTAGGDLEPNHAEPHPDDDALSDAEATGEPLGEGTREPGAQSAKDNPSVLLQHVPNGGQYCGKCSLYVPDQNDDGFGACVTVEGKIHPCDYCILFTEYNGDDAATCEQV